MKTNLVNWPRRAGKTAAASELLAALVADADGHQKDRRKAAMSGIPGVLRDHLEITPAGELVSAHRTAL